MKTLALVGESIFVEINNVNGGGDTSVIARKQMDVIL